MARHDLRERVAPTAMAFGVGLYIIPLGMIANPNVLRLTEDPLMALFAFARIAVGLGLVSYGLIGVRNPMAKAGLVAVFAWAAV